MYIYSSPGGGLCGGPPSDWLRSPDRLATGRPLSQRGGQHNEWHHGLCPGVTAAGA